LFLNFVGAVFFLVVICYLLFIWHGIVATLLPPNSPLVLFIEEEGLSLLDHILHCLPEIGVWYRVDRILWSGWM